MSPPVAGAHRLTGEDESASGGRGNRPPRATISRPLQGGCRGPGHRPPALRPAPSRARRCELAAAPAPRGVGLDVSRIAHRLPRPAAGWGEVETRQPPGA